MACLSPAFKTQAKDQVGRWIFAPKLYYVWIAAFAGQTFLEQVDACVRQELKRWLHVPPSTTDNVWYTSKRDGGLGFPKLLT